MKAGPKTGWRQGDFMDNSIIEKFKVPSYFQTQLETSWSALGGVGTRDDESVMNMLFSCEYL